MADQREDLVEKVRDLMEQHFLNIRGYCRCGHKSEYPATMADHLADVFASFVAPYAARAASLEKAVTEYLREMDSPVRDALLCRTRRDEMRAALSTGERPEEGK